jgi:hypothetical protein
MRKPVSDVGDVEVVRLQRRLDRVAFRAGRAGLDRHRDALQAAVALELQLDVRRRRVRRPREGERRLVGSPRARRGEQHQHEEHDQLPGRGHGTAPDDGTGPALGSRSQPP